MVGRPERPEQQVISSTHQNKGGSGELTLREVRVESGPKHTLDALQLATGVLVVSLGSGGDSVTR